MAHPVVHFEVGKEASTSSRSSPGNGTSAGDDRTVLGSRRHMIGLAKGM